MPMSKISIAWNNLQQQVRVIFIQDKILIILFLLSLFLNLALYLAIYWLIKPSLDSLILHYTVYFGIDLIGQWYKLYLMPIVGSFLFLVNFPLALFFYKKEKVASYLLTSVTFLIELFLAVGGGLLIWVNY